jgi:diguanylate cyclase (GGDEF)-like protein
MMTEQNSTRSLRNRFSLLVTIAVILVLTATGFYFDNFLKQSFLESTRKKMTQGFYRLSDNLTQIEKQLRDGIAFATDNELLVASIELINNYQDKNNYNIFLIDEEKKTISQTLLDQVRLTFSSNIAIYNIEQELQVYIFQTKAGSYSLNFHSFDEGKLKTLSRLEHEKDYEVVQNVLPERISQIHKNYYDPSVLFKNSVITYQQHKGSIIIKSHQNIFDSVSGKVIAHIEMTKILDKTYFENLSKDLGIQLSFSFQNSFPNATPLKKVNYKSNSLTVDEKENAYLSTTQQDSIDGPIYFLAHLDKHSMTEILVSNRQQLLFLLIIIALITLLLMRFLIHHSIAQPLSILMEQIYKITHEDYSDSHKVTTGDELESISKSVNSLATVIQEREKLLIESAVQMEFLSNHDTLTNLPNRRFFSHKLEQSLASGKRNDSQFALFFLDLDDFKLVNDTLGHDIGDELLRMVSMRLQENTRESDTLARIGGDEFNLIVKHYSNDNEVTKIAKRYLALFQMPFHCFGHDITISVSIGISRYPEDGFDATSLVKHADLAMYKSKDSGRNGYSFFTHQLSVEIDKRAALISDLKAALKSCDEFEIYYQPKVSVETAHPVSAEALIRWNSSNHGFVSPVDFIPIAEETGLIIPLGKWIINQVCNDIIALNQSGFQLEHISINVSNAQLRDRDILKMLIKILKNREISSSQIELEITESYIASDAKIAIKMLQEFRDIGINLAIDDFGTGYSSMSYLQNLPVTRIKIDKSFVDGIPHSKECVTITNAIISLAKSLGHSITAEGVEHEDQLDLMKQQGVDEIQGYYYSKPLPMDKLKSYLSLNLPKNKKGRIHFI